MKNVNMNNHKASRGGKKGRELVEEVPFSRKEFKLHVNNENKKKSKFFKLQRTLHKKRVEQERRKIRGFFLQKLRIFRFFKKKKDFPQEFCLILCSVKQLLLNEVFFVRFFG